MEFVAKINAVRRAADFYKDTGTLARHARRLRSGSMNAEPPARRCSSPSTPRATTSGTPQARRHQTFENIYALGRLHEFFARHGVRPTYVITYPVATRSAIGRGAAATARARRLRDRRAPSRLGNAAVQPDDVDRHPYALSLPLDSVRCAARVADARRSTDAVGARPVSYRSGRFGFSAAHVSSLERQGYLVDSSVAPLFYEAHKQGPDFVGAPLTPYFLAYDDATRPGSSNVLELPISAALNRRVPALVERLYARAPWPYTTKRVLRLARIAHVRWLRPSYSSAEDMIALARQLVRRGAPILNLLFHSSEAIVGGSPYNRTQGELDAFFDRLATVPALSRRRSWAPSR